MNLSYKLVGLTIFFLSSHYPLNGMEDALVAKAATDESVQFAIPLANTLQEACIRRIIATLKEDSPAAEKLLAELESNEGWYAKIKVEFINEHLVLLADIFKNQLKVHYIKYYEDLGTSFLGFARSGAFILDGKGLITIGFQLGEVSGAKMQLTVVDFWILDDLLNEKGIEKKPRDSQIVQLNGTYPSTRIYACQNSNRFIIQTPKVLQVWTVKDDHKLFHETSLEVIGNGDDISLSPDGSAVAILPKWWHAPGLLLSLTSLCENYPQKTIPVAKLEELSVQFFDKRSHVQWSPCGNYIATIQSAEPHTIMLWQISDGLPNTIHTCPAQNLFPTGVNNFTLSPDKRFLLGFSLTDKPSVHILELATGKSECIYKHSEKFNDGNKLFYTIQCSDDGRYCLISLPKEDKPILYDLQHKKLLCVNSRVLEYCPSAKMDSKTLNSAQLSKNNNYIFSINLGVPQVIALQQPISLFSLNELILLVQIVHTKENSQLREKSLVQLLASMSHREETKTLSNTITRYFNKE